jgi:hypothetical protein
MMISDPIVIDWVARNLQWAHIALPFGAHVGLAPVLGAIFVVASGRLISARVSRDSVERPELR